MRGRQTELTSKTQRLARNLKNLLFKGRRRWLFWVPVILIVIGIAFYLVMRPGVLPQVAIWLLDDVTLPGPAQVVLVFSPHPDDETIAAGGYIAASVREGAIVKIVLVTDGGKGPLNNPNNRCLEFKKASALLGVPENDLVFLGLPDGNLKKLDHQRLREMLREQIDTYNPDFVIYPDPRDQHPDHSTIGTIIQQILEEDPLYRVSYSYVVHYQMFYPQPRGYNPNLYLLPPIGLIDFDSPWQRFMLSEEIENTKQEAIYAYKSQLRDPTVRWLLVSSIRKNELFSVTQAP
jgi:LmbE family N-acetylglucosaminyl deacetylase